MIGTHILVLFETTAAWRLASRANERSAAGQTGWGGWDSNPGPADYEKYGPALRVRYLHRYHGVEPPMALIAPFARATRSTNRSTPYHGDHRMPATERYRRQRPDMPGLR
jgi:hypothetical protein